MNADAPKTEALMSKVRSLLAKAEDPAATPAEAQAFSAKAEYLITKYAIDSALLQENAGSGAPEIRKTTVSAPYAIPKIRLLSGIASVYGCQAIREGRSNVELVGFGPDLDTVELLYASLHIQGTYALLSERHTGKSFRNAFWSSFANRVYERLRDTRREVEDCATGAALVLADRASAVQRAVEDAYPDLRSSTPSRASCPVGWSAGTEAADGADVGVGALDGREDGLAA